MYSKKRKLGGRILTGVLALSMMAFTSGCGAPQQAVSEGGKIAVICKAEGVSFWDYVKKGAEDAGEELGYQIVYSTAKTDSDVAGQMDLIRKAIDENVKAIVIAPNSAEGLGAVLTSASSKGIKIITINSDIKDESHSIRSSYIGSSNSSAGAVAGRQAAQILGSEGGEIAVIGNTEGQQSTVQRISGFKDTINSLAESSIKQALEEAQAAALAAAAVPGDESAENPAAAQMAAQMAGSVDMEALNPFKFVAEDYCDNNRATAKKKALEMIEAHPGLKMMYGVNENSTLGICDAVAEKGLGDQITVIGFNSNDEEIKYLENGVLDGLVVQSPYNMGYLGVRYCTKLIDGDNITENIDTGVTYVNRENLSTDIVQLLLNPDKE